MRHLIISDPDCGGVDPAAQALCSPEIQAALIEKGIKPYGIPRQVKDDSLGTEEKPWRALSEKVWNRYKRAAHLWTAFIAPGAFESDLSTPIHLCLNEFQHGGLKGFLQLAEEIRHAAAERLTKPGPPKPLIPLNESWNIIFNN